MRLKLALLALLANCATTHNVSNAGRDVSIAAQHATSLIDSAKQIATSIEQRVQYTPDSEAPRSPLDAILQAAVTTTPDLIAIYRAGKLLVEQLRAMKQKAEQAP